MYSAQWGHQANIDLLDVQIAPSDLVEPATALQVLILP
jgi:hypothetical protein